MTWIEWHTTVVHHPKTYALQAALGVTHNEAVGILGKLWLWCIEYADDGVVTDFTAAIEVAMQCPGLMDALVATRFVDRDDTTLKIHDWEDYAGKNVRRRKANAARMNRARAEHVQRTGRARAPNVQSDIQDKTDKTDKTDRETRADAPTVVLSLDGLEPVTTEHVARWAELRNDDGLRVYRNVVIESELESMREHLATAPPYKLPKKLLTKFARNWLNRAARDAAVTRRARNREDRQGQAARAGTEQQLAELVGTKVASDESLDAARQRIRKTFGGTE